MVSALKASTKVSTRCFARRDSDMEDPLKGALVGDGTEPMAVDPSLDASQGSPWAWTQWGVSTKVIDGGMAQWRLLPMLTKLCCCTMEADDL